MTDSLTELLAAVGAGPVWLSRTIEAIGPGLVADLVLDELVERADFPAGPSPEPAVVRFVLAVPGSAPVERLVRVDTPEQDDRVRATVHQDLAELAAGVFGGDDRPPATRRIVWDDDTPVGRDSEVPQVAATVHRLLSGSGDLDLGSLAVRFGSDKWGLHYYTPLYERYLRPVRTLPLTVLEIGIGGFDEPGRGGSSLRMWRRYFRRGRIYGIDVAAKHRLRSPRVETFQGHQADPEFLAQVLRASGDPDVVIDDGSHRSEDILATFAILYPRLRHGGLYFIEDLQTSYWPGFGGSSDPAAVATTTGFLKSLIDSIHYEERPSGSSPGQAVGESTTALHIHHNLAVIEKGVNREGSLPEWHPARA